MAADIQSVIMPGTNRAERLLLKAAPARSPPTESDDDPTALMPASRLALLAGAILGGQSAPPAARPLRTLRRSRRPRNHPFSAAVRHLRIPSTVSPAPTQSAASRRSSNQYEARSTSCSAGPTQRAIVLTKKHAVRTAGPSCWPAATSKAPARR